MDYDLINNSTGKRNESVYWYIVNEVPVQMRGSYLQEKATGYHTEEHPDDGRQHKMNMSQAFFINGKDLAISVTDTASNLRNQVFTQVIAARAEILMTIPKVSRFVKF